MFEKEAKEYLGNFADCANCKERWSICADSLDEYCLVNGCCYAIPKEQDIYIAGAKLGYNKGKEDVKYDLMMKLKDEGIVKPLKDSILRNERLSSQEQQELCAWIECAMEFGENLDKCAKELEEANKANEWHYVKMKDEIKKKFDEWVHENGGTDGVLYQTFSDNELEHIFMSAYVKNNKR